MHWIELMLTFKKTDSKSNQFFVQHFVPKQLHFKQYFFVQFILWQFRLIGLQKSDLTKLIMLNTICLVKIFYDFEQYI